MTMKTEPFLSGKWGWDLGEGDWKDGADENFLKFSYMLNGNVDGFVSSLPSSPSNGTAYFLTTNNTLNARIDGAWYSFPTPKGFTVTEKATGAKYEFTGSAFVSTFNYTDKVKLNSISSGATVNSSDASLRDRTTHTGVQPISTITSLQSSLDAKAPSNSPTFTGTPTAPTVVTSDNSTKLATTAWVKSLGYATSSAVTTVAGRVGDVVLSKTDVGLTNVDNTADTAKPVSTAQQNALDLKLNINNPTLTGTVTLPSTTSIGSVSSVEIGYLDGVSSPIQAQIDSITGVSGGYAPINNPTFTGTVSGITKSMVGLSNVDNTADISKPISTLTQAALNNKQATLSGTGFVKSTGGTISYDTNSYASTASPTFTGTVTLPSTTTIGSVTGTQLGYLVNTTSDIQSQINTKAPSSAPTFQSAVTVNAASGQSSVYFQQAGTNNGRIYAGGGAGTDVIVEASRFVALDAASLVKVVIGGVERFNFSSTTFTLPSSARITGDFSNTTNTSRALVQTNVANGITRFDVIPNGTSTTSTVGAFNNSDPTNASWGRLTATASDVRVESTVSGTGTALPLNLYAGGSQRVSVLANGNILVNTSTDSGYKFDVNGTARVAGDFTTNGNLQVNKPTPVMINSSTTNPVATMSNYISFKDNTAAEVGWMGFGAANGEMGFSNSSRNIRFLSPVVANSNLTAPTIIARANAGTTPTYNFAQLQITNAGSGNPVALGFHAEGSSACELVHLVGGNGLELYNTTFGNYANLKVKDLNAQGNVVTDGTITSTGGSNSFYSASGSLLNLNSGTTSGVITCQISGTTKGYFNWDATGIHLLDSTSTSRLDVTTSGASVATQSAGNNTTLIANTAFVQTALTSLNASNLTTGTVSSSLLPAANTSVAGIVRLDDSLASTSTVLAATANCVRNVYVIANSASTVANLAVLRNTPYQTTQAVTHSVAGTLTIDLALGSDVQITVSANITTLAFSNIPTSSAWSATLEFIVSGTRTITWPTGTRSASGVLPTLSTNGTDVFVLRKRATDNYMVFTSGKAMA